MIDQEKVKEAVRLLLKGIGEDTGREGLIETPDRIARMYGEICGGMEMDVKEILSKTFVTEKTEMVLEKDIASYAALFRKSAYRLYSGRTDRGAQ